MQVIDLILIILLLIGGYHGYKKGLLLEVIGLAALILAIIGGIKLLHWGIGLLAEYFDAYSSWVPLLAFILIFAGIIILVNILGRMLKNLLDLTLLGSIDNLAGALLGIFKWAFGISVIIWVIDMLGFEFPPDITEQSFLFSQVEQFAPQVIQYISTIFPFVDELFDSLKELIS
ncbi:MAG: CvpA family protein [Candidatus Cyclobacteriaceae bacterium M3_2C_046]